MNRALRSGQWAGIWYALAALLLGCAPSVVSRADGQIAPSNAAPTTLVLALGAEPSILSSVPLFGAGGATASRSRIFNAALTISDGSGQSHPYLAETIPRLGTSTWALFPDGTMETVYTLRANATWQDGTPLRAPDFAFAWRVMTDPDIGLAGLPPQNLMQEVIAPDDLTLQIRWRQPYPDAGRIDGWSRGLIFPPFPRHLLEGPYEQVGASFRNLPFWTTEYVGAGPFQLDQWERGAFIGAHAFEGHALGTPRVQRLKILVISDPNAVLAQILAGEVHVAIDNSIRITQGLVLRDRWAPDAAGSVDFVPGTLRWITTQQRAEYANPRAILDIRVRRALAHSMDKQAMNEALFGSQGTAADTLVPPGKSYFPIISQAITRYPFNSGRSEQLMNEAGYRKEANGAYVEGGTQLAFGLITNPTPENESERSLLAAGWRATGFGIEEGLLPAGSAQEEARSTFRSLATNGGAAGMDGLSRFTSTTVTRPENRWVGENRGGWSNPDYDRAARGVQSTLDSNERIRQLADAARVMSEDLGVIFMHYSPIILAHPSSLQGMGISDPEAEPLWNIYEWELR